MKDSQKDGPVTKSAQFGRKTRKSAWENKKNFSRPAKHYAKSHAEFGAICARKRHLEG